MSDPSSFTSFQDYLGLNDEAGQQMLDKSMGEGDKLRAGAVAASDAHYNAARASGEGRVGGEEAYQRTGEQARKGLASYGEFMQGMADPAARQTLMEKTYGKGSISALDSAVTGASGGGRVADGRKEFQRLQIQLEDRDMRADARKKNYANQTAMQSAEDERGRQAQAANRKKLEEISAANREREEWKKINDAEDKFRQESPSKYAYNHYAANRIDPATGKAVKAADYKAGKVNPQYGWGGAGTLKSANGGSL